MIYEVTLEVETNVRNWLSKTRLPLRAVALSRANAKIVVFGDRPETRLRIICALTLRQARNRTNNKELAVGDTYPVLATLPSLWRISDGYI